MWLPIGCSRSSNVVPSDPGLHLLEAERQGDVALAGPDRLRGQVERAGPGRAVAVDVEDRDAGEAELVRRPVAAARLAVHVADEGLLDRAVADRRRPRAPWCRPPWPSGGSPSPRGGPGFSNFVMPTPITNTRLLMGRRYERSGPCLPMTTTADLLDRTAHRAPLGSGRVRPHRADRPAARRRSRSHRRRGWDVDEHAPRGRDLPRAAGRGTVPGHRGAAHRLRAAALARRPTTRCSAWARTRCPAARSGCSATA